MPTGSLIIPCFNEAHRLPRALEGALEARQTLGGNLQILFVDDGSTDDTFNSARALVASVDSAEVLSRPHLGKGAALRAGVLAAEGEFCLLADADWSMPPGQFARFFEDDAADIIIASREHPRSIRHGEPWSRHALGRAFNFLVRALVLPSFQDTQCGFKVFRREIACALFSRNQIDGWAYDVEVLLLATRLGYRVREVPIDWHYSGDTRVRPLVDAWRMAGDLLRIRALHPFPALKEGRILDDR